MPELNGSKPVYKTSPKKFCLFILELLNSGAAFIGGCCGTNPQFIRAVSEKINIEKNIG